jgi:predicted ribosome quality control (RQC) complex YloA/Tae2 family protein
MVIIEDIDDKRKIMIGQNQTENEKLCSESRKIFKSGTPVLWFHLADTSSPHGFIIGHSPSKENIYRAAVLVKKYSKEKKKGNVKVNYLSIEYVQKTDTPGMVNLTRKPTEIKV